MSSSLNLEHLKSTIWSPNLFSPNFASLVQAPIHARTVFRHIQRGGRALIAVGSERFEPASGDPYQNILISAPHAIHFITLTIILYVGPR